MPDPEVIPPVATPAAPKPSQEVFSREYVSELREESKGYRTKAQEADARALAAEANLAKLGKESDEKVTAAQAQANERIIRAELKAEAVKAGMVDLDGLKLADLTKVKLNDKGEVEGADALMAELKKSKPYLFGVPGTSHVDTKVPKPGDPVVKNVKDMTPEEYAKAKQAAIRGAGK